MCVHQSHDTQCVFISHMTLKCVFISHDTRLPASNNLNSATVTQCVGPRAQACTGWLYQLIALALQLDSKHLPAVVCVGVLPGGAPGGKGHVAAIGGVVGGTWSGAARSQYVNVNTGRWVGGQAGRLLQGSPAFRNPNCSSTHGLPLSCCTISGLPNVIPADAEAVFPSQFTGTQVRRFVVGMCLLSQCCAALHECKLVSAHALGSPTHT
jgi:hypothetical protein